MAPAAARRRRRRGAAAVETAVTLPICFLIFAGVVNVCQTLHVKDALTLASYESGRLASRRGVTTADVRARCEALLTERGIRTATITVTPSEIADLATGQSISIGVQASLKKNVVTMLAPSDVTVRGGARVLRE